MSLWLELKYVNALKGVIPSIKEKSGNLYILRCPKCGDSVKHKTSAHGYIFEKEDKLRYFCHRCSYSAKFEWFLKEFAPHLYAEYLMEAGFAPKRKIIEEPVPVKTPTPVFKELEATGLPSIDELPTTHPARAYVAARNIPARHYKRLHFAENFNLWVATKRSDDKYDKISADARLVIPFWNTEGKLIGAQGRALSSTGLRYETVKFGDDELIYGLERVKHTHEVRITEGPIDSLFLKNAIAVAGSSLSRVKGICDAAKDVFVFDNEPRNPQIVKLIGAAITNGWRVVLFPENMAEKDINDMVLAGHDVEQLIQDNTYQGLDAELKFAMWKKV